MNFDFFIRPANFTLYNIKKTQIEMLIDRGYDIPESEKRMLTMDEQEFKSYTTDLLEGKLDNEWIPYLNNMLLPENAKYTERTILGNVYRKADKNCLVVFLDQQGGKQIIKAVTDAVIVTVEGILSGEKFHELILITRMPFSVESKACINDLKFTQHWIFFDKELTINITKSKLVPPHRLLSTEEAIDYKRKYKHFNQISEDDAVVKYYGWRAGGVVLITRDISELNTIAKTMIAKRLIVRHTAVKDGKK